MKNKRERLLDAFLSGAIEKDVYSAKVEEIKAELEKVEQSLSQENQMNS